MKNKHGTRRNDSNIKDIFTLSEKTKDIKLGVYGCVIPKNQFHKGVEFGELKIKVPRQLSTMHHIVRLIWISSDYIT
jgi:hypothetical protein